MRSLGVRLALWYGAGIALLLVLLGGFLFAAVDRYLTGQALNLLRAQALPLQRLAEENVHSVADLRVVVNQITERPAATGVGVFVVGPAGQLLGRSKAAAAQELNPGDRLGAAAFSGGRAEGRTIITAGGVRYLLLYRPVTLSGRVIGALVLSTSLAPVDGTMHEFVLILGIGIGATLLVSSLVVILVTRVGLRPLRDMASTSLQIADGDFGQRVKMEGAPEEVETLATAFNHMAERLQASFHAQRVFVADASHELRTPLTSLAGYLDILQKGAKDEPANLARILGAMRGEVDRMGRLVRDLVALARLDAGDQLQLVRVDITRVVEDVYEQTKAMAPGRQVNLRANEGIWVEVDVDRIRQVLLNLADNAIKYTAPEAQVNFAVQSYDSTVQVSVADNGPGIPPEAREQLFDRFYRGEQSRSREKGGAGLGLAIAKKIVEAHHGTITLTTPAEGGSIFSVRLPLA